MKLPLVSILIPYFEHDTYIKETILNCFEQDYPNIEIILVDDGSKKSPTKILEEFPSIIYQRITHTGIPAIPRNLSFKLSSGEYIQFLDADDLLHNKKISSQVKILEEVHDKTTPSVVYCDYLFFQKNLQGGYEFERLGPKHAQYWPNNFFNQYKMYTIIHRFMYPRSVLEKYGLFDESMSHAEDLDLWLRLQIKGVNFIYQNEAMAFYRAHHSHSLRHPMKEAECMLRVVEKSEVYLREEGFYNRFQEDLELAKLDAMNRITINHKDYE